MQPLAARPAPTRNLHTLLLQLPLLRSLNGEQLNLIAQACHLIPIAQHDFVFRKGDSANGLYIVASGSVKLSLSAANGQEKIIEFFREGDIFGEALMFLEMPYMSQAQALKDMLLIWIKKEDIDQALELYPILCVPLASEFVVTLAYADAGY